MQYHGNLLNKLLFSTMKAEIIALNTRVRHKSIRNLISHGIISLDFVRSKNNIADPLTKGLPHQQVLESSRRMGLKSII